MCVSVTYDGWNTSLLLQTSPAEGSRRKPCHEGRGFSYSARIRGHLFYHGAGHSGRAKLALTQTCTSLDFGNNGSRVLLHRLNDRNGHMTSGTCASKRISTAGLRHSRMEIISCPLCDVWDVERQIGVRHCHGRSHRSKAVGRPYRKGHRSTHLLLKLV